MADAKKPPPSNSSRTVVIVAVAVLIIVAIAGIVLAGRKSSGAPEAAVASAPAAARASSAAGSTPQVAAAPTDVLPKDVTFAAASDKLPAGINEGLARFAEEARGNAASSIRLSARFLTGANKERDRDLAKARTGAIRHSLESNGVNSGKVQIELIEMAEGALTPDAANRVDLSLR